VITARYLALALPLLCVPLATGAVKLSGFRSAGLPVALTRSGYHVDVQSEGAPLRPTPLIRRLRSRIGLHFEARTAPWYPRLSDDAD
jgi:hypothetical protein